jgi:hypothetical protein
MSKARALNALLMASSTLPIQARPDAAPAAVIATVGHAMVVRTPSCIPAVAARPCAGAARASSYRAGSEAGARGGWGSGGCDAATGACGACRLIMFWTLVDRDEGRTWWARVRHRGAQPNPLVVADVRQLQVGDQRGAERLLAHEGRLQGDAARGEQRPRLVPGQSVGRAVNEQGVLDGVNRAGLELNLACTDALHPAQSDHVVDSSVCTEKLPCVSPSGWPGCSPGNGGDADDRGARLLERQGSQRARAATSAAVRGRLPNPGQCERSRDAVQETWLRFGASPTRPTSTRAFLSAVVTRISIDVLRSARVWREEYLGPWFPELLLAGRPLRGP